MIRRRALQIVLVLVGGALVAGTYPLLTSLLQGLATDVSPGDQMILGIYVPLGILLLLAVPNPSAHRSLIAFAGWSTVTHMSVMVVQAFQRGTAREDVPQSIVVALIGAVLIALMPPKPSIESAPVDRVPA